MSDALVDRLRLKFPQLTRKLEGRGHAAVRAELPFYRRHALVTLTIDTPLPQRLHYLDEGVELHLLQGAADVAAANARERLQLMPQHAEPYVRFALRHGLRVDLVERPEDLAWYSDADQDPALKARKDETVRALRPLRLVISPEGGFEVVVTLRARRDLVERRYKLSSDGRLDVLGEKVLVTDVPASAPMQ